MQRVVLRGITGGDAAMVLEHKVDVVGSTRFVRLACARAFSPAVRYRHTGIAHARKALPLRSAYGTPSYDSRNPTRNGETWFPGSCCRWRRRRMQTQSGRSVSISSRLVSASMANSRVKPADLVLVLQDQHVAHRVVLITLGICAGPGDVTASRLVEPGWQRRANIAFASGRRQQPVDGVVAKPSIERIGPLQRVGNAALRRSIPDK